MLRQQSHNRQKNSKKTAKLTNRTSYGIIKTVFKTSKNKHIKKEARCLMTIEGLKNATARYERIISRLRLIITTINTVEMVTPVNLSEAKEHWIENAKKGVFINPKFHYDYALLIRETQKLSMLANLKEELVVNHPSFADEAFIYNHINDVIDEMIHTLKATEAIISGNTEVTAEHFLAKYGRSDQNTYSFALNLAQQGNTTTQYKKKISLTQEDINLLESAKLDAKFIAEMFIWAMEQYSDPWPVEILSNSSAIDVRDRGSTGRPAITVPANRIVNGFKLLELIGHEVECHWRGSQNVERLGMLKSDEEIVYEGVAKLKDYNFGARFLGKATMPQPYYVIAEHGALMSQSFAEVGKTITDYLNGDVKRAWTFTYRTFRGTTDTVNEVGYAFTKDRAYLEGYLYAKNLKDNGKAYLLDFSSLSMKALRYLDRIIGQSNLESIALHDQSIQERAMYEILRRIKAQ